MLARGRGKEASTEGFFVAGGSLPADTPSYVERAADRELYPALLRGEFCYVLTSRQMGKSSLMVRTAARLRESGVRVAVVDLTAVGQNLTPEQWYEGMLLRVGEQLDLEDMVDDCWSDYGRLGPVQRFMAVIRRVLSVVSPGVAREGPALVLFVDEIDAVRSLPFSAGEFFAAIRECYNRRSEDPDYRRLTFCLLGVATPSDLIGDPRLTPFNIGRRIELTDFAPTEALALAEGLLPRGSDGAVPWRELAAAQRLVARVLHWTGGHPYLTQRLCGAVAAALHRSDEEVGAKNARKLAGRAWDWRGRWWVDRLAHELFLAPAARDRDDNLLFVRERLLRGATDLPALLELYARVRRAGGTLVDPTDARVDLLLLAGIASARGADGKAMRGAGAPAGSRLVVRNRIYRRVFDAAWIRTSMPDAEARRQRSAYRRGMLRAAAASAGLLAAMVGLTVWALRGAAESRRLFYLASINLAQADWEADPVHVDRVLELLQRTRDYPGRGFEWGYWWLRCHPELEVLTIPTGDDSVVACSPDGRRVAVGGGNGVVQLLSPGTGQPPRDLPLPTAPVQALAFSPAADRLLAVPGGAAAASVWDGASGRRLTLLPRALEAARAAGFALNGNVAWVSDGAGGVETWDAGSGARRAAWIGRSAGVAAMSPDGARFCAGRVVWRAATGRLEAALAGGHERQWIEVRFSADGRRVAGIAPTGQVAIWDAATGGRIRSFRMAGRPIAVSCSAGGERVFAGTAGGTGVVWDVPSGRRLVSVRIGPRTHPSGAFGPLNRLFTAAAAGEVSTGVLWDLGTGRRVAEIQGMPAQIWAAAFSADGRRVATVGSDREGMVTQLWEPGRRGALRAWRGPSEMMPAVAFSGDGSRVLARRGDGALLSWDATAGAALATQDPLWERAVAAAPAAGRVVTADGQGTLRLRDLESGMLQETVAHLGAPPLHVALTPDGRHLAAAGPRGVQVFELGPARRIADLPEAPVQQLALSPDGRFLAAAQGAATMFWNLETGASARTLEGVPLGSAFSPDSLHLLTVGRQGAFGTGRLWSCESGEELQLLLGHRNAPVAAAWADDRLFTVAGDSSSTRLWRVGRSLGARRHQQHGDNAQHSAAFSLDGRLLLTAGRGGPLRVTLAATGDEVVTLDPGGCNGADLAPDGRSIAATSDDRPLTLWTLEGRAVRVFPEETRGAGQVAYSPDGRHLACVQGSTVAIWEVETSIRRLLLVGHQGELRLRYSSEGQRLVTADAQWARVWDAATGRRLAAFPTGGSSAACLSPDGRLLAVGSGSGEALVWDLRRRRTVLRLRGHTEPVKDIAFTPDGRRIATGSLDGTVKLWDAGAPPGPTREVLTLKPGEPVTRVEFSPDGARLVTTGLSGGDTWVWESAAPAR